jgi:hypothetical protein
MRQAILDHIDGLTLGSFNLSSELPWSTGGTALYLKNLKRIYVDADQITEDLSIAALNGLIINNETTTVRVFFACDAKQLPSNYETVVSGIRTAKSTASIEGVSRRECDVATSFEEDIVVTEFEFRFIKIT